MEFKDHELTPAGDAPGVLYEERPLTDPAGGAVPGLHTVRITLDNPAQLNSYTTAMVKGVILGLRRASNDRAARGGGLHRLRARAPSAPAATPPSTPSTTPAGPRSTASTCGSSTTWSAPS